MKQPAQCRLFFICAHRRIWLFFPHHLKFKEPPMQKPTIYPLFSSPVYVNNVGNFPRPDLTSLEYSSTIPTGGSYNFLSSSDKHVLDRQDFAHVRAIVMREVETYTRQLLAVNR